MGSAADLAYDPAMVWWQQSFVQVTLPVMITVVLTTWYQCRRFTAVRDSIGKRIDEVRSIIASSTCWRMDCFWKISLDDLLRCIYHANRSANCIILGANADVIVPKLLFDRFEFGARKFVLFSRLKHSA
jgi:hypothetical protein